MRELKPTSPRVQRNREVARAILREGGVAALSMQELARRMDMLEATLFGKG